MKPLRIKKRVSAGAPTEEETSTSLAPSASPVAAGSPVACLAPSPPPVKGGRPSLHPGPGFGSSPAAAGPTPVAALSAAEPAAAAVKLSSELDNAAVEAYLEYLIHPHTSWESASRHLGHRREVIEEHRNFVYARSRAVLRRLSFASTPCSEGSGLDALVTSTTSSASSASAGFPRTAANGSKTSQGTLRKGRLGDVASPLLPSDAAEPFAIVTHSSSAVSSSRNPNTRSRTPTGTGQQAPSKKGRLSRGTTLTGPPRPHRTSSSATTPGELGGCGLTIGGTRLVSSSANLFVVNGHCSAVTSRTASRDGIDILHPTAPEGGGRNVTDCKRTGGGRTGVPPPQPKCRLE
ncbi:hypothetical protein NXY56_003175 [Leishmania guyanensis]